MVTSKTLRAIGAGLALLVLLVAPPVLLITVIGNPWPAGGVALNAELSDGAIIGLLAVVVWVLWAQLLVCVIAETRAALAGRNSSVRVPATFGFQRDLARRLVTAVVVAAIASPVAGAVMNTASAETTSSASTSSTSASAAPAAGPRPAAGVHGPSASLAGSQGHQPASTTAASTPSDATAPAAAKGQTVTVHRGDDLWSIADRHLGDGSRWKEIRDLNEGHQMTGGGVFKAAEQIQPGWDLQMPADAQLGDQTQQPAKTQQDDGGVEHRTVHAGDTLSEIALEETGDAESYPELAAASDIADPDHIEPGWSITIPDEHATTDQQSQDGAQAQGRHRQSAPESPAQHAGGEQAHSQSDQAGDQSPQSADDTADRAQAPAAGQQSAPEGTGGSDDQPAPQPQASQTPQPGGDQETAGSAQSDAQSDAESDDGPGVPVRTGAGVGSLLAAGILALLAVRRRRQQRRREPGQRIPMPQGEAQQVEQELRAVAAPLTRDTLDHALRALGAQVAGSLPDLRAARLTSAQLDLYLAEPDQLPAPWVATADATVWTLSQDAAATVVDDVDVDGLAAPWPALVVVGHDAEDGHVMLNLEHLRAFTLTGDPDLTRAAIRALAVELGTCTAAGEVEISLTATMQELSEVLDDSTRYVPTVRQLQQSVTEHRDGAVQVAFVDRPLDSARREELLGEDGVAVVSTSHQPAPAGEWALDVSGEDGAATIQPLGLPVTAQLLDEDTYQHVLDVLTTAAAPAVDTTSSLTPTSQLHIVPAVHQPVAAADPAAEPDEEGVDRAGDDVQGDAIAQGSGEDVDGPSASATEQPHSSAGLATLTRPETGQDHDAASATAFVVEKPTQEPQESASTSTTEAADRDDSEDLEHVDETETTPETTTETAAAPVIRLLTSVPQVTGARGELGSSTHRAITTEIAAYMALHPHSTTPALTQAIWSGRRISDNTRRTAVSRLRSWLGADDDGQQYLPRRELTLAESVTTDWAQFTSLAGHDPRTAASSDLEEALALVDGPILTGVDDHTYTWAEDHRQEMISAVVDASYELAKRRLMEGRWRGVEEAAATGVLLEPGTERLWRVWILAAHSAGNPGSVAQAKGRMHARISDLGFTLETETIDLIAALENLDEDGIAQARAALLG